MTLTLILNPLRLCDIFWLGMNFTCTISNLTDLNSIDLIIFEGNVWFPIVQDY